MLLMSAASPACTLSERDLDAFQHTATGPEKLRAILADEQRPPRLRAHAALDLLDLSRREHDGSGELFSDLARLPAKARGAIVPGFLAGLEARIRTEPGQTPSSDAVRAKDAGVELLAMLEGKARALLGAELVTWTTADMPLRADVGRFSLEAMAGTVGADAATTLLEGLTSEQSPHDVLRLARAIDELAPLMASPSAAGGPTTGAVRSLAAERLIVLERAYRAPQHDAVLDAQTRRELFPGGAPEPSVLKAQVAARRRGALTAELLPAIGLFADQAAARVRLVELGRSGTVEPEQRSQALSLLAGHVTQAELSPLLELALDQRELPELREAALARAGETHAREALPSLLMVLSERTHASLRQRAGELSLEIGGPETLPLFFRAMPHHWDTQYGKREIDAYSERLARIQPDNTVLLFLAERLHAAMWWHRVLALRYFAYHGSAEHVWRIRQHLADPNFITGDDWPAGHTVGQEARAALNVALERLHGG
jgi:hypothetical protein